MKVSRSKRNKIHFELLEAFTRLDEAFIPEIPLDNRKKVEINEEEVYHAVNQLITAAWQASRLALGVIK